MMMNRIGLSKEIFGPDIIPKLPTIVVFKRTIIIWFQAKWAPGPGKLGPGTQLYIFVARHLTLTILKKVLSRMMRGGGQLNDFSKNCQILY